MVGKERNKKSTVAPKVGQTTRRRAVLETPEPSSNRPIRIVVPDYLRQKQVRARPILEGMHTMLSTVDYYITRGVIVRAQYAPKLVGYCVEDPFEVLERLFSQYEVTQFNGVPMYYRDNFSAPMRGLAIDPVKKPEHIRGFLQKVTGSLQDLLKVDRVQALERERPISQANLNHVLKTFNGEGHGDLDHRDSMTYAQRKRDNNKVVRILLATVPYNPRRGQ